MHRYVTVAPAANLSLNRNHISGRNIGEVTLNYSQAQFAFDLNPIISRMGEWHGWIARKVK